jgi:hypothetical protein
LSPEVCAFKQKNSIHPYLQLFLQGFISRTNDFYLSEMTFAMSILMFPFPL